jgi:hypothetical protein
MSWQPPASVLTAALLNRSWRGVVLGLQPAAWCAVLVLSLVVAAQLSVPLSGAVLIPAFTIWALIVGEGARRRAYALVSWFPEAIFARGGNPVRVQPIVAPDLAELNRPGVAWRIVHLEGEQLQFQRAPGEASRRGLAVFYLVVGGASVVAIATAKSFVLAGALALVVGAGTAMLWTGAVRELSHPWRAAVGGWPEPWQVIERPSRVLGLAWVALGLVFAGIVWWAEQAPSVRRGLDRSAEGIAILCLLWEIRGQVLRLQRLEGARVYQAAQRLVAKLAVPVWHLMATMRAALYALALIAFWAGPVLGEAALTLAVTSFGLALMVSPVTREWKRPQEPVVINVQDGAQVLALQGVERRLTVTLRLLLLASLVWKLASA